MLLARNSSDNFLWVHPSTWTHFVILANYFLIRDSVVLVGDFPPTIPFKPVYVTNGVLPPKHVSTDVIMLISRSSRITNWDMRGNAIIVTESLQTVHTLWPKYRLVPLIVFLTNSQRCEIFIWLPYKKGNCREAPKLTLVSSCEDFNFEEFKKMEIRQKHLAGCPLKVSIAECPLVVEIDERGNLSGIEIELLKDLTKEIGMELDLLQVQNARSYFELFPNGSTGALLLLEERQVDMAGSCQTIVLQFAPFEIMPSHLQEQVSWHLPGPQPIPVSFGFATALPFDLWIASFATFVLTLIFSCSSLKSAGKIFLWLVLRMLSMPSIPLRETTSHRLFSVTLEIGALVLTSLYKSVLLFNLFVPAEIKLSTAEEGARYGLTAYIRPREQPLMNYTSEYLSEYLKNPNNLKIVNSFNYDLLVVEKSAMMLARSVIDQALIRRKYPDIPFTSAVTIQQNYFTGNNIALVMYQDHPLGPMVSVKVLEIIAAGLPKLYLSKALAILPKDGARLREEKKPLGLPELQYVFYMWVIFMISSGVIFLLEIVIKKI